MIVAGRRFEFIMLVVFSAMIYISIRMARMGKIPYVKTLPGVDALDECVGRAAEMGRPIFFSTGYWGLDSMFGTQNMAGLTILGYIAKLAGKYGAEVMYFANKSHMVPIAMDLIMSGYKEGGRPEMFSVDMVRYVSDDQVALQSSMMDYISKVKPAVVMQMGAIYAEANNMMAAGARIGALQAGGSAFFMPYYALICDYRLFGDELYAAGALISEDRTQLGQVRGMDWNKLVILFLFVLSAIMVNMGLNYAGLIGL